ncbi:DUF5681 domain-containing protein [Legionella bozemanae]|uniref:DUF5681 domain-containing protein n=1 Tax=Legionella bozemanae TaxID=447 RepID=UPI001041089C|nr:DUF5681 domain-containing protein [Legionella bozemanae]
MTKFKKGQSGNPSGKKPGTHNKRTALAKLLEPHAENLINKAVELALEGDVNALKLCLDRLLPRIISQPVQFDMNDFDAENIDNLSAIGKKIILAISVGNLSPEEGQRLMNILDDQRKLIEHVDMSRKLDEISEHYQLI